MFWWLVVEGKKIEALEKISEASILHKGGLSVIGACYAPCNTLED